MGDLTSPIDVVASSESRMDYLGSNITRIDIKKVIPVYYDKERKKFYPGQEQMIIERVNGYQDFDMAIRAFMFRYVIPLIIGIIFFIILATAPTSEFKLTVVNKVISKLTNELSKRSIELSPNFRIAIALLTGALLVYFSGSLMATPGGFLWTILIFSTCSAFVGYVICYEEEMEVGGFVGICSVVFLLFISFVSCDYHGDEGHSNYYTFLTGDTLMIWIMANILNLMENIRTGSSR
ncbi:hypothetical protein ACFL08_01220 [Patescibacteria group bacterium]